MSAVGVLSRTRTDWTRPKRTCECTLAPTRFRHSGSTEGPDVFGTPRSESLALGLPLAREFTRQTSDSPLTVGGRRLTGAPSKPRVAGSSPAGRAIAYPRGFAPRTPLHGRSRGPHAPFRSRGSLACAPSRCRGFAPRTPLHAPASAEASAGSPKRLRREGARSRGPRCPAPRATGPSGGGPPRALRKVQVLPGAPIFSHLRPPRRASRIRL
jgi:hypothetical protein